MQEVYYFRPQFFRIIPTYRKNEPTEHPVTGKSNHKRAAAVPIVLPQCFLAISVNQARASFGAPGEQTFSMYGSWGNSLSQAAYQVY
jgi:hypothetical protein